MSIYYKALESIEKYRKGVRDKPDEESLKQLDALGDELQSDIDEAQATLHIIEDILSL